jgi:hypothetical protein
MNSPLKVLSEVGLIALMLLILSEIRAVFDTKRAKLQLFSVATAVIILGASAVPTLIGYAFKMIPASYGLVFTDMVLLGAFIFAVARFIQLCFSEKVASEPATKDTDISEN